MVAAKVHVAISRMKRVDQNPKEDTMAFPIDLRVSGYRAQQGVRLARCRQTRHA
jgi:hypothetical protein